MTPCDYAACHNAATARAGEWNFCTGHLREHRALQRDDDRAFARGRGFGRILVPCGTSAAYRRHLRHGEDCDRCRDAATRARHGYVSTSQKQWAS